MHPSMLYKLNLTKTSGTELISSDPSPKPQGLKVEVKDIETGLITIYSSLRSAAFSLNCSKTTFIHAEKKFKETGVNVLYKGRYITKIIR